MDVVARLGTLVSLAALLVVAGAVGGMFDGMPVTADPTAPSVVLYVPAR